MKSTSQRRLAPPLPNLRHALFLDFDGTLVELADHPDQVIVPELLPGLLSGLERRLGGAVAMVTGRRLDSLDARLAPLKLRAAGLHGAQIRAQPDAEPTEARSLTRITERLKAAFAGDEDVWVEDKGAAVAVHYRRAPQREAEVRQSVMAVVANEGVEVISGKCVFEARGRGHGKDAAIRNLMRNEPFRDRIPVFIGDDVTDEDGIREAQSLGGIGIKVGPGDTAAEWRLADTQAVIEWLRETLWSLPDV